MASVQGFGTTETFKGRQQQRDFLAQSVKLLSNEALTKRFQGLTELAHPQIQSIIGQGQMIGSAQAGAVRANLGRAGLGGTFAEDIAAGFQTGAAFQSMALRSRILQDLIEQSIGIQSTLSGGFAQGAGNVPTGQNTDSMEQAGKAIAAAGAMVALL